MRRNMKSLGMVAFTACVLVLPLLAATPAQAQTYSITGTLTGTGGSGPAPDGGQQGNVLAEGNWSTAAGDTADTILATVTLGSGSEIYGKKGGQGELGGDKRDNAHLRSISE